MASPVPQGKSLVVAKELMWPTKLKNFTLKNFTLQFFIEEVFLICLTKSFIFKHVRIPFHVHTHVRHTNTHTHTHKLLNMAYFTTQAISLTEDLQ